MLEIYSEGNNSRVTEGADLQASKSYADEAESPYILVLLNPNQTNSGKHRPEVLHTIKGLRF